MRSVESICSSCLLIGAVLFGISADSLLAGDDLERQYQTIAKQILTKLRDADVKTTGVLKFSVRIGEGRFPQSVGALNMRLAQKLELALVMANPAIKAQENLQVGIVRGASDVANTIPEASHLTPEGRKALFSKAYPLAWKHLGKSETVPDSLIVGVAEVHSNLSQMDIELLLLSRTSLQLTLLTRLTVPTDLEDLIDSGESFTTRGLFDGGQVKRTEAAQDTKTGETPSKQEDSVQDVARQKALAVRTETLGDSEPQTSSKHPLSASGDSPITFEIHYDGSPQSLEFRDGAAFVKEPREGQNVVFIVRRKGNDKQRYGVLVRVNGENTLYRERVPDLKTTLWILEPELPAFSIQGFQLDEGTREQFRVLSDTDSEKRTIDYGRDVGMISIVVYQEDQTLELPVTDEKLDLAIQTQTVLPDETKETRGQLGKSLIDQLVAQDTTRGLIAEGEKTKAAIDTVSFKRNSVPVMATSIRYYNVK